MKIRKTHILARHFFNVQDNSAGNFFTEEDGWLDWLWCVIEETDSVYQRHQGNYEEKRTSRCWGARKSRAKDAHDIYNGVIYGPRKNKSNVGLDCVWLLETVSHHSIPLCCSPKVPTTWRGRWMDFFVKPFFSGPFKGQPNIKKISIVIEYYSFFHKSQRLNYQLVVWRYEHFIFPYFKKPHRKLDCKGQEILALNQ